MGIVPPEPPFPPAKGRAPEKPFQHWPLIWLLVGLALLALKIWAEYQHQPTIEIEVP